MIKLGVLTNKTRAKLRSPLIVRPASAAAILTEISRMAIKRASLRGSREKQTGKKPSGPVQTQPDTRRQVARPLPQNGRLMGTPARGSGNTSSPFSSPRPQNGKPSGNSPAPEKRPGSYNSSTGQHTNAPRPNTDGPLQGRPVGNQPRQDLPQQNEPRTHHPGSNNRSTNAPADSNTGKNNFTRPNSPDRNATENRSSSQPSNSKWNSGPAKPGNARNGMTNNDGAAHGATPNRKPTQGPAAHGATPDRKPTQGPAANGSGSNGKQTVGPAANSSPLNGKPTQGSMGNGTAFNGKPGVEPATNGSEMKDLNGQNQADHKRANLRSQDADHFDANSAVPDARSESESAKEAPKGMTPNPKAPEELDMPHEPGVSEAQFAFEDLAAEIAEPQEIEPDPSLKDSQVDAKASLEPADLEQDAGEDDSPGQGDQVSGTTSNAPDSKSPPANEKPRTPGNIGRSSLFRPDVFASMTTFRVPTKMEPPRAEPPQAKPWNEPPHSDSTRVDRPVQIPMEVHLPSKNGQNGSSHNGNGKSTAGYPPVQPSVPRSPNLGNQPGDSLNALQRMLGQHKDLPEQVAILGVGEDGLPVLFDLQDPTPGAVVTISDERQAELEILKTAVASLTSRGSARSVQFLVFSVEPEKWRTWINEQGFDRHCLAVVGAEDENIREWTLRLADWTEQRRLGQRGGPPVLLVMDTLNFLTRLAYDVRLNFEWMAKEGPQAQIWPLAAISSELAKSLNQRRLLRAFPMRILGCLQNPADYVQLENLSEEEAADFGRSGEFAVHLGEHWLRFHLLGRK